MLSPVTVLGYGYQTVTATQTAVVLGSTGTVGDQIHALLVTPTSAVPGSIVLTDGTLTSFNAFSGGTVASLAPFMILMDVVSKNGPWKVTTGANMSLIATGYFT